MALLQEAIPSIYLGLHPREYHLKRGERKRDCQSWRIANPSQRGLWIQIKGGNSLQRQHPRSSRPLFCNVFLKENSILTLEIEVSDTDDCKETGLGPQLTQDLVEFHFLLYANSLLHERQQLPVGSLFQQLPVTLENYGMKPKMRLMVKLRGYYLDKMDIAGCPFAPRQARLEEATDDRLEQEQNIRQLGQHASGIFAWSSQRLPPHMNCPSPRYLIPVPPDYSSCIAGHFPTFITSIPPYVFPVSATTHHVINSSPHSRL